MNAGAVALALSLVACPIGRTETDSDSSDDTDTTTDELPCAPVSSPCGPSTALVTRVIDGDTVELE
ncbi:MAG: hypothetical protein KC636_32850, partial [Myxococcales bacterium]|nr:hypothetical protein [Myxococcales bacterium]